MAYRAPPAHVDAFHFVQTLFLEPFDKGLLVVKLHPIHLRRLNIYVVENFVPQGSREKMV